jgi:hypothetical protein
MIQYKLGSQVPFTATNFSRDTFLIFISSFIVKMKVWINIYVPILWLVIFGAVKALTILRMLHEGRK